MGTVVAVREDGTFDVRLSELGCVQRGVSFDKMQVSGGYRSTRCRYGAGVVGVVGVGVGL
jgi:hypothetical protein